MRIEKKLCLGVTGIENIRSMNFEWNRFEQKTFGGAGAKGSDRGRLGTTGIEHQIWVRTEIHFFGVESNSSFRAGAAHGKLPAPTPGRATPPPPYLRGKHLATW